MPGLPEKKESKVVKWLQIYLPSIKTTLINHFFLIGTDPLWFQCNEFIRNIIVDWFFFLINHMFHVAEILLWSGYFSVCWTISKIRQSKKNHSFASYSKFFGISEYLNMSVFYVFILFWIMVLASMTSFDKHLKKYT